MLGFGGAIFYSEQSATKLDADAVSIATNASPAIEHLTSARGAILRIQLAAASAIQRSSDGATADRSSFDDALSHLHRELAAYRALPFYPEERIRRPRRR
jgi:hypothetical protein